MPRRGWPRILMSMALVVLALPAAASSVSWGKPGHGGGHERGHQAAQACAVEFDSSTC